jgi:predicted lysophospholipase L1 biosynthesis ABC-type transport system permease subunit
VGTNLFPARVVGIVADSVNDRPDLPTDPEVYLAPGAGIASRLLVRWSGNEAAAIAGVQAVVARVWGTGTDRHIVRLADEMRRATSAYRGRTKLLGLLTAVVLPLAIVGLVGALSYATRQRAREIGIRIALGADPAMVRHRVVVQALLCVAVALVAGVGGGVAAGRWGARLLFGVGSLDWATVAGVALLLLAAGWLAALVPARRAASVDPAVVLRDE